jgi:hypothetical protein
MYTDQDKDKEMQCEAEWMITTTMPNKTQFEFKKSSKNNKIILHKLLYPPKLTPKEKTDIQLLYQGNDDEEHKTDPRWASR